MVYGYIRVSSKEQNVDRQMDALLGLGINKRNIFTDKQSGKDFESRHIWLKKSSRTGKSESFALN